MKPINIKHFCRLPIILVLIISVVLPVSLLFLIGGIINNNTHISLLGAIPIFVSVLGLGFYFNYGIRISQKYVILIYFTEIKVFHYDDVEYINIHFDNESIWGDIKAKKQKAYSFYFDSFELDPISPLAKLWIVNVKISDKYIEKCLHNLSMCNKTNIYRSPK